MLNLLMLLAVRLRRPTVHVEGLRSSHHHHYHHHHHHHDHDDDGCNYHVLLGSGPTRLRPPATSSSPSSSSSPLRVLHLCTRQLNRHPHHQHCHQRHRHHQHRPQLTSIIRTATLQSSASSFGSLRMVFSPNTNGCPSCAADNLKSTKNNVCMS